MMFAKLSCCSKLGMTSVFAGEGNGHVDWKSIAKARLERALETPINTKVARNVIMLVGDGMGVATVTAGRIYAAQQQGRRYGEEPSLAFERFPHVGLAKVQSTQFHDTIIRLSVAYR